MYWLIHCTSQCEVRGIILHYKFTVIDQRQMPYDKFNPVLLFIGRKLLIISTGIPLNKFNFRGCRGTFRRETINSHSKPARCSSQKIAFPLNKFNRVIPLNYFCDTSFHPTSRHLLYSNIKLIDIIRIPKIIIPIVAKFIQTVEKILTKSANVHLWTG